MKVWVIHWENQAEEQYLKVFTDELAAIKFYISIREEESCCSALCEVDGPATEAVYDDWDEIAMEDLVKLVPCAYCKGFRTKFDARCKGCGASEVMA